MQNQRKCHQNVWILSGTADGPILADKLLSLNYVVFVSVVSNKAKEVYQINDKLHIITGKLEDANQIQIFIVNNQINHIIDATHPFAIEISINLKNACDAIDFPIFKYERLYECKSNAKLLEDFTDLENYEIENKKILLAIGSRSLNEIASFYINAGAQVFARIIASPESILGGFSSCISNSNLAILNPSKPKERILESFLCNYWNIDYVLCRDSGGYSHKMWDQICYETKIKLFLLKRPEIFKGKYVFSQYDDLIKSITNSK